MVALIDIADRGETVLHAAGGGLVSVLCFEARGERLAFGHEDGAAGIVALAD